MKSIVKRYVAILSHTVVNAWTMMFFFALNITYVIECANLSKDTINQRPPKG